MSAVKAFAAFDAVACTGQVFFAAAGTDNRFFVDGSLDVVSGSFEGFLQFFCCDGKGAFHFLAHPSERFAHFFGCSATALRSRVGSGSTFRTIRGFFWKLLSTIMTIHNDALQKRVASKQI